MKTKIIISLTLLLAIATACSDWINHGSTDNIVVNCVLEIRGVQYADLYYADKDGQLKVIDDAIVKITDGKSVYQFWFNGSRWVTSLWPSYGTNYKLTVSTPLSDKSIEASTSFPYAFRDQSVITNTTLGAPYFIDPVEYHKITADIPYFGDAFMWITAEHVKLERVDEGFPYRYKILDTIKAERLCTDHAGVSDFNVCNGKWKDLSCINAFDHHYQLHLGHSIRCWEDYKSYCNELQLHRASPKILKRNLTI